MKSASNLKLILHRIGLIVVTGLAILTSAASCTIPGLNLGNNSTPTTLGVLKQDPSISTEKFGKINAVQTVSGQVDPAGLSNLSGLKMQLTSPDNLYLLTTQKGLFKTTDGGRNWKRKYIFNPVSNNSDSKARDAEINSILAKNDALVSQDFAVDPTNQNNIFYAVSLNKVGKIYYSNDGGDSFKEVYTEVASGVDVKLVTIDSKNPLRVYAVLQGGGLIGSLDGGKTWQKLQSFNDQPVQIGFTEEFGNLFYILFAKNGLAISANDGKTWVTKPLVKEESKIGENQPKDNLNIISSSTPTFGTYEKIIPVTTGSTKGWILLADRQMWFSSSVDGNFSKLLLPVQSEQYNVLDAAVDPKRGLDQIIVGVDNKLFTTTNRGQSWTTNDKIGLSAAIGNIGQIVIDPNGNNSIYLMLLNPSLKRGSGLGLFI
jgi:photosystem II stability/assembly factor-like uncharacterized protein